MGMNYYWHEKDDACERCGRRDSEGVHIGKSSYGWRFSLHILDEWEAIEDWERRFNIPGSVIVDEEGRIVPPDEMMQIITSREKYVAPNLGRLSYHDVDGVYCIGRGWGDFDYCIGEFF